jgi:hypothetical protein
MKATEAGKLRRGDRGQRGWNPGYVLVNNKDYPQIADDYAASPRCANYPAILAAHIAFYDLESKYPKLRRAARSVQA